VRTYTDEQLVAYADGELPAAEAQAVAQAAAADPELARRIRRFTDTRRVLHDAFAAKLREPVPDRLLQTLAGPEPKVVPLRRARPAAWVPMALAASLALAVGLGVTLWPRAPGTPVIAALPPDAGALAQALDRDASGEPRTVADAGRRWEILPKATLRTASGWCREFESSLEGGTPARARAVACRTPDGAWEVVAVAAAPGAPAEGRDYAPAGGDDPGLLRTLGAVERLTPAQEAEVIRNHWRLQAPLQEEKP
jgi:hypothetical protein